MALIGSRYGGGGVGGIGLLKGRMICTGKPSLRYEGGM